MSERFMNALETLDTKHVAIHSDTKDGMRIRGEKGLPRQRLTLKASS